MIKRLFSVIFLILIFKITLFSATLWVGGCGPGANYPTIQQAINASRNGDTIKICAGTYNESVRINGPKKNLTITDAGDGDVTVQSFNTVFNIGYNWQPVKNLKIENLTIKGRRYGIYFREGENLTLNNLIIFSQNGYGFYSDWDADGNFNFSNLNINSKKTAIRISKAKTLEFDNININITGNYYGIYLDWNVTNDNSIFSNIHITTNNKTCFLIRDGQKITFENINLTNLGSSSNAHGIYLDWNVSNRILIKNSIINVSGKGILIRNGQPIIDNCSILSRKSTAVFCDWNTSKVSIQNSRLESQSSSSSNYSLKIQNSQSNAHVNNNCFYHSNFAPNKLAYADQSGNDFNGNYWENFTGSVYHSGNVVDYTPLSSCPISIGELTPIIEYRMDECNWDDDTTTYEVINNGILNGNYDATSYNSNTLIGKICKGGDFISTSTEDKYLKPKNNIPLPSAYSITLWIKFPLNSSGHKIFYSHGNRYRYYNIADRPGSNKDFIYFRENVLNHNWELCVRDRGVPECKLIDDFNSWTGWHFLVFTVESGWWTRFYLDGTGLFTFNQGPSGTLGLIFNSDYGGSTNEGNQQSLGAVADEFKIFSKILSSSEIDAIYNNEKVGKNYDGSERTCPYCGPVADWHFDECFWNGTSNEVKDNTSNHYDGTAMNGTNTTADDKVLCRAGVFDGIDDFIHVDNLSEILKGTASLSFWIKTTQIGNNTDWKAPGVTGVEQHGGIDDIFWGWIDANGHIGISKGDNFNNSKSNTPINDGKWHHIVLTRNAINGRVKIYIDGNLDKIGFTDSGIVGTPFSSIGRIENTGTVNPPRYFKGKLDEIMVFNKILSTHEVEQIYNNQRNGKNWDGTDRECPTCGHVDHYEIIHDSNALTCQPEDITIRACANENCSVFYTDNVTLTLTPSGWIGGDTKSFYSGEATFQLQHTTPETVTLGIDSANPNADYCCRNSDIDSECVNDDEHCNITFYESGFVFNVPNQISCKDSSDVLIKAVRKDDITQRCVPAFANVDKDLKFWFDYNTPSSNPYSVKLQLKGNNDTSFIDLPLSEPSSPNVSLHFNSNGEATFKVKYNDAGKLNLHAKLEEGSLEMVGDSTFTVKPWAFYIDIPGNPEAQNSDGPKFKKAGENFTINVKAVCWQNGDNVSNNNDLQDNVITRNYNKSGVEILHSLIAPIGGESGELGITSLNFSDGEASINNEYYTEVGIIHIKVKDNNYLSAGSIEGNVNYVGRFYPDHFKIISKQNGKLVDKCNSIFTYIGDTTTYEIKPQFVICAKNLFDNTTKNYKNGFFKLTVNDISIDIPDKDDNNNLSIEITKASDNLTSNGDGTANYTFGNDIIKYVRNSQSKIAPFSPKFTFKITSITDSDGVTCINLPDNLTVTGNLMKYGRLKVIDNYGPETDNLTLDIETQFWNGTWWELNSDDTCTLLDTTGDDFQLFNYTRNLDPGETSIINVTGIESGKGSFTLSAPGEGNSGTVDINLKSTSTFYPYLYDPDNGTATFGIYRGRDRIIFWKEIPANE